MQVPGAIFIKIADWAKAHIDVKKVGQAIVEHIQKTQELPTRYVQRLMPVDFLCKANKFDDFKEFIQPVLGKYFPLKTEGEIDDNIKHVQWCVEFKRRNNDKLNKAHYVDYIVSQIDARKTSISYDFADVEVIIQNFREMLIVSVLPGFKRDFKKYNLQMLAGIGGDDEMDDRPTVNVMDLIKARKAAAEQAASGTEVVSAVVEEVKEE